jgi:hypothetical protein
MPEELRVFQVAGFRFQVSGFRLQVAGLLAMNNFDFNGARDCFASLNNSCFVFRV